MSMPDDDVGTSWPALNMNLGPDMPMFLDNGIDPLGGFDIPFWMEQDSCATWMGDYF